ncbi:MAG TPA: NAD(P)H-hydrate dehydratase [Acidimicrobiales bacterium]|jgi:NAD(P)H-hydrate epimerase|nr:NAD(P)H-hydrate dehydratase [Acidimicrobiales bacterium]
MLPVLTPDEMAAVDAAAPEPVDVLIGRAGAALARRALAMLGGSYGRRVVVVAGKGNNGNDGREAARLLERRGVNVHVIAAPDAPPTLPDSDLVIDAAYGTGFRGEYVAPDPAGAPVLAVDIPSGVDGLTGEAAGRPAPAVRTVTFAALKPGLLFHPGRSLAGEVTVADIGLDVSGARAGVVDTGDVARWVPARPPDSHKWRAAVMVAAGSPGMTGAAHLATRAAYRAGAGMVRVAIPGLEADPGLPTEAVGIGAPAAGWDAVVLEQLDRMGALVLGPGLGRGAPAVAAIHHLVGMAPVPVVVDGDGLSDLGGQVVDILARRSPDASAVLTPHDGEFTRLAGAPPGPDRIAAARGLAADTGAIVLLKGPTTVVAHPDGRVRLSTTGDARLATAGTGDVLSGLIGALLARGADAFDAAAAGAWLHGRAAQAGPAHGLIASDVVEALPATLATVTEPAGGIAGGSV